MKTTTRQLKTTSTGTNMFIFLHENRDFWDKQVPTITISILCISILTSPSIMSCIYRLESNMTNPKSPKITHHPKSSHIS
jgi:hypothetical protein